MNKTLSALVPLNETRKRRGRTRKGDACAHCRLKKRKCDARKPICTSCHAEGFTAGCDYTPLKLRPRTEFYEEKIRLLEEQIDRYLRPRDSPEEFSPYGVFPVSMSPQHSAIVLTLPYAKRSPSVPSYNSVIRSLGSWTGDLAKLPPSGLCAHISESFVTHQSNYSFDFLDPSYFLTLADPDAGPHPAVKNVILLIGCLLHGDRFTGLENVFLMRTRHHLSQSLAHADRLLDFLDASSLLSSYFYAISRLEEGYHHASSAMLFAVACGLHCLAPPTWAPAEHQSLLPCVRDQSDLERRVRIWWRVFAVDRTANTLGNCPILVPDDKIKTPWVVPPHALVTNRAFTEAELSTVQSLYRAQSDAPRVLDDNVEVLRLKGIVLLERASSLGRLAPTTPRADTVFWHTFVSTDEALNQFIACLPPLYDKRGTETLVPDAVRAFEGMNPFLVVIHTFAFTARLRLHSRLAQADSITSYDHSIEAIQGAMSVVDKISSLDVGEHLSALASVCWQSIFVFLAAEYKTIQNTRQHETRAAETRAALKSIFSVIHKMAKYFPVLYKALELYQEEMGDALQS